MQGNVNENKNEFSLCTNLIYYSSDNFHTRPVKRILFKLNIYLILNTVFLKYLTTAFKINCTSVKKNVVI